MVRKPIFKIVANGVDVTEKIQAETHAISFTDQANNEADELTIEVGGQFARPKYQDELELYLGYGDTLTYCGSFKVQTTDRRDNNVLSISATGVDFSKGLKEKRDQTYEKVSLKDICSQIASRNNLKLASDYDEMNILSTAQSQESDLHFLNRLAKEYNAIFNIKNNTLVFTSKIKNSKKNDDLPLYTISKIDCQTLNIKHSNRTYYNSCKSVYHDSKTNEAIEVVAGAGEPCLLNHGSFKDEAEAKVKAAAKLEKANQGLVSGSLSIEGEVMFAGGRLNLTDTLEDDGEYQVKSVQHTIDENGWVIDVEFEN